MESITIAAIALYIYIYVWVVMGYYCILSYMIIIPGFTYVYPLQVVPLPTSPHPGGVMALRWLLLTVSALASDLVTELPGAGKLRTENLLGST